MVTLTINRKPQGIFSKSPATPGDAANLLI